MPFFPTQPLAAAVVQPLNEPWNRHPSGAYGKKTRLTFSEAIGVTGGTQTTNLDASLNGNFFGKFMNVATHMGGAGRAQLLLNNYPSAICTISAPNDAPHAEDYLLTALETEWIARGNNWLTNYAYRGNVQQQSSLLSIRMNRAPCPRCAKNLHRYCRARGLSLRIKATFFHSDTDTKGRTGTSLLDSKGKPVRQWDTARILNKAPKGAPAHLGTWEANQFGKASNPYKTQGRAAVEQANWGGFNNNRVTHQIPLLQGWAGAGLSRAAIQNKSLPGTNHRGPSVPAPPVFRPTPSTPSANGMTSPQTVPTRLGSRTSTSASNAHVPGFVTKTGRSE